MNTLYTIGHSNHSEDYFIDLLKKCGITAVADVRSSPYSRYNPHFNRENIIRTLKNHNIAYVFLGKELGPRADDPSCYVDGKVSYRRLAETQLFKSGVCRLEEGMKNYRVTIMCSEKDPIFCHRMVLICRSLRQRDVNIEHILEDGSHEKLEDSELRLLAHLKIPALQLFDSTENLILRAYEIQAEKIAFKKDEDEGEGKQQF